MTFYPATVVKADHESTTVRFDESPKEIRFYHNAHNALPPELRQVGLKGYVSFPKAPPVFTAERVACAA